MTPKPFSIHQLEEFRKRCVRIRGIITNTGWLFADRILRMGVGLFVGVWVARYLGVEQFGVFNYASAFVALFSSFSSLGLDAIAVRWIVGNPKKKDQILGTVFWLKLFGGLVYLLLAVSFIAILSSDNKLTIYLVAILASGGIFQSFNTIELWFESQVQSKHTVIAKNTAFILISLTKVILINISAPLLAFAWVGLAEIALASLGLIVAYHIKGYSLFLWRFNFLIAQDMLKESWPLILAGFSVMIYMKVDQIMLGEMVGNKELGIYSAAARISEIWYFIPVAIASSFSPSIFAAKQLSEKIYYNRIENLARFLICIALIISIPISFFARTIITSLFGSEYQQASLILQIHIWSSPFVFLGCAASSWYIAEGLTNLALRRTIIALIINIVLNLFMIPKYSGMGAAFSTLISYAVGSVFANATHEKTHIIFNIQMKSIINTFLFRPLKELE